MQGKWQWQEQEWGRFHQDRHQKGSRDKGRKNYMIYLIHYAYIYTCNDMTIIHENNYAIMCKNTYIESFMHKYMHKYMHAIMQLYIDPNACLYYAFLKVILKLL